MTDVTIAVQPATSLFAFEIWSNPQAVAKRFETLAGFALPGMGHSARSDALCFMRFEPTMWLTESNTPDLSEALGDDGAITAIGGGIVRVMLSGKSWRRLLMEGGVFDAENPAFATGCTATTVIDHVNVRLHVLSDERCMTYVPLSYSTSLLLFWEEAIASLGD